VGCIAGPDGPFSHVEVINMMGRIGVCVGRVVFGGLCKLGIHVGTQRSRRVCGWALVILGLTLVTGCGGAETADAPDLGVGDAPAEVDAGRDAAPLAARHDAGSTMAEVDAGAPAEDAGTVVEVDAAPARDAAPTATDAGTDAPTLHAPDAGPDAAPEAAPAPIVVSCNVGSDVYQCGSAWTLYYWPDATGLVHPCDASHPADVSCPAGAHCTVLVPGATARDGVCQ